MSRGGLLGTHVQSTACCHGCAPGYKRKRRQRVPWGPCLKLLHFTERKLVVQCRPGAAWVGPHNPAPYTSWWAGSGRRWLSLLGANGWEHVLLESIVASTALLQRFLLNHCNPLATWCEELTHWKTPWCWERWKVGREGDDRGRDGWMASPTQWAWVWVNSGSWWWTGRPGVLQSMGSQRHDWATELKSLKAERKRASRALWVSFSSLQASKKILTLLRFIDFPYELWGFYVGQSPFRLTLSCHPSDARWFESVKHTHPSLLVSVEVSISGLFQNSLPDRIRAYDSAACGKYSFLPPWRKISVLLMIDINRNWILLTEVLPPCRNFQKKKKRKGLFSCWSVKINQELTRKRLTYLPWVSERIESLYRSQKKKKKTTQENGFI